MNSVADVLSGLIRIPSPSAVSNRPLIDFADAAFHAAGWLTRALPYRDASGAEKVNLIAAPSGQDPAAQDVDLVFICHTDTVPFAADWSGALDPAIQGGNLHGCGACDVKGFLACLLTAISGPGVGKFPAGLRIVLTADEEIGCLGASRLLAQNALRPRRMVIGEPTLLHPARAGKGYCIAEVTVHGREAHSAHPGQGVSAIYHAARLIAAIEGFAAQLAAQTHPFFDPAFTTINIGTIQGGTAKNIVPGLCRFQLEWRPIPGQPPSVVLDAVTQIVDRFQSSDPTFRADVMPMRQQPGFETPADAALVRSLEALTGRAAASIPFGSEASIFSPIAEEVIVMGPGDMRTAHSSRECVPLAQLDETVACLRSLMRAG